MIVCHCGGGTLCTLATYLCILYTAVSVVVRMASKLFAVMDRRPASPAIKPENYQDSDLLLRRSLAAVNWSLVANKAKALHSLKGRSLKRNKLTHSASFTFGHDGSAARGDIKTCSSF